MKKNILLMLLMSLFSVCSSSAQLIDNKLNIYAGITHHFMPVKEITASGEFRMPSFYGGMRSGDSRDFRVAYKLLPVLSLGLGYTSSRFYNWQSKNSHLYQGASASGNYLGAIVMLHSPSRKRGIFNRLRITTQLQAKWGYQYLNFERSLVAVYPVPYNSFTQFPDLFHEESGASKGVDASLGAELALNRIVGVFVQYGYDYTRFESNFHDDISLGFHYLKAGLFIRMLNNKRYYY